MRPIVMTIGEPAGIGPDIALAAWTRREFGEGLPPFVLLADPGHLSARALKLGLDISIRTIGEVDLASAGEVFATDLPVLPLDNRLTAAPSEPTSADAVGIIEAIDRAVALVRDEAATAIVTLPISKASLYEAGFTHPGHTEYLGALAQDWPAHDGRTQPVMMLAGPDVRTVPVTIHIPLADVPSALTTEAIVNTARITHHDLKERFGVESPRLAISGLNPHAGEGGALGTEDEAIIAPAIEQLQSEGIECFGPLPADTMFHAAARIGYDAAICMYHDQALIPAKALAFDETVNVTLGLPFVRTSPDHGTAFDIAGTGKANPASLIAALRMADAMTRQSGA